MKFDQNRDLVEMLFKCAAECEYCTTMCLEEDNVKTLTKCIKLNLMCSQVCITTAIATARESIHAEHLIKECIEICELCAKECAKHDTQHCKKCADICSTCAEKCKNSELAVTHN